MKSTETHLAHEMLIEILPLDIDQPGHVNNVIYLRWVQAVATEHWHLIATKEQIANLLWVVKKHEIEYKRPAFESDRVIARTWIGEMSHRVFERHTELLRESDRRLLAKATTLWTPVDLHTKKAVRVDPALYAYFLPMRIGEPCDE